MDSHFMRILEEKGLSRTSVRLAVLELLDDYPHSDAAQIFEALRKRIPAATIQAVYNNLSVLVAVGLIREIKPKGRSSLYETRVDDNHHHIVCRKCSSVMDTDCKGHAPCLSPANSHGYTVDEAEVIFWGICPACQKSNRRRS